MYRSGKCDRWLTPVVALLLGAFNAPAQLWSEIPVPPPSGLEAGSLFGWSVALDEGLLFVGAPGANSLGVDRGAVFVFERNAGGLGQWEEVQRIEPADLSDGARFGTRLDVHAGLLLVGAPFDGVNGIAAGAIYSYRRGADGIFEQVQRITPTNAQNNMRFGERFDQAFTPSVPLLLAAAPPGADCFPGPNQTQNCLGSVALFSGGVGPGYEVLDDFCPPDGLYLQSSFAPRIAVLSAPPSAFIVAPVNGRLMITDVTSVDEPDVLDGAVWPIRDTLVPSDVWGMPIRSGGSELASKFGYLFSTARTDSHQVVLAHVADLDVLHENGVLLPDTFVTDLSHRFGYAIATDARAGIASDEPVVVGAPGAEIGMPVGSCTMFQRDPVAEGGWRREVRLVPSDAEMGALFGASVALSWPYVAAGAPGHGPDDKGKVYVFTDPAAGADDVLQARLDIELHPVPTNDVLTVTSPIDMRGAAYSIIDASGRIVKEGVLQQTTALDLRDLPVGLFLLRVPSGANVFHERFLIAR